MPSLLRPDSRPRPDNMAALAVGAPAPGGVMDAPPTHDLDPDVLRPRLLRRLNPKLPCALDLAPDKDLVVPPLLSPLTRPGARPAWRAGIWLTGSSASTAFSRHPVRYGPSKYFSLCLASDGGLSGTRSSLRCVACTASPAAFVGKPSTQVVVAGSFRAPPAMSASPVGLTLQTATQPMSLPDDTATQAPAGTPSYVRYRRRACRQWRSLV